jgi:hypothetical protein
LTDWSFDDAGGVELPPLLELVDCGFGAGGTGGAGGAGGAVGSMGGGGSC